MKKYLCAIALLVCLATTAVAQSEFSFPLLNNSPVTPLMIPYLAGPPILPTYETKKVAPHTGQFSQLLLDAGVWAFTSPLPQFLHIYMLNTPGRNACASAIPYHRRQ